MSYDKTVKVDASEDAAAAALKALGANNDTTNKDNQEKGFSFPQRFTKSGRKKAVPFPMKVRRFCGYYEFLLLG